MEKEEIYLTEIESKQLQLIHHYGLENQLDKLIEESSELVQAICKWRRNNKPGFMESSDGVHLIEELADVLNLIEQIKLSDAFIAKGINTFKDYKVDRELKRISSYDEHKGLLKNLNIGGF